EETLLELLTLYQRGALCAPFDGTVIRIDYDENSSSANTAAPASTAQSDMSSYASAFGFSYPTASAGTTSAAKSSDEETDGIAVVKMAPDKSMKVSISVDENDILSLEKGQLAEVTIESVGKQAFTGLVTEVDRNAAAGASGTGAYAAEVTFAKEKGMLGGMTAEVVISIQGTDNVLIIPTDAVNKTAAGAFVYTEYDEETKQFGGITPIEVGISNDDDTEVRSGLEEGMTVYYTEKKEDLFFMMMGGPNGMNGRPNSRPGGSYPG
ncbi:MAG: efflux RND transporter periplasmic adaptor subunit, partial [Oscillospiraceae bacterium]|nr:efflux RND transporter periplasmic adaptor subunit [Oscillospiraceae bacterium]